MPINFIRDTIYEEVVRYYKNILETVENTPLVRLTRVTKGIRATILAKIEFFNPGGSIKDRIGIAMIKDAEKMERIGISRSPIRTSVGIEDIGDLIEDIERGLECI